MRDPDATGPFGKAWEARPVPGGPADWGGSVGTWIAHVPGAHPAWSYWMIGAVHLRPIEGAPPAKLHFPGATHEFMIAALDPDQEPVVDWEPGGPTQKYLTPIDLVHQVDGVTDEQAGRIVALMVRAVLDGFMSPDSDFREAWKKVIDNTVKHFKEGKHPLQ